MSLRDRFKRRAAAAATAAAGAGKWIAQTWRRRRGALLTAVALVGFVITVRECWMGNRRNQQENEWHAHEDSRFDQLADMIARGTDSDDRLVGFGAADSATVEAARLQWRRGDTAGAIARLDPLITRHRGTLASLFNVRGVARLAGGDDVGARWDFERALAIDSTYAQAHLNIAASFARSSPGEALQSVDRALQLRPDYVGALQTRGSLLILLGRPRDAIPDLERATRLQPTGNSAWEVLATAQGLAGDIEGMCITWEDARRHNPRSARAWYNVAICHYNRGDVFSALDLADSALARQPDTADLPTLIWGFRAHVLARQGRDAEAIASVDSALSRGPTRENRRGLADLKSELRRELAERVAR
jgi:tetratricopeptide (TPR) repeat protein